MTKVFAMALLLFASMLTSSPPVNAREGVFHFIFAGDTCFGESYNIPGAFRNGGDEPGLYDSSIETLAKPLLSADWTMVNLETPLTEPIRESARDKKYLHWANPAKTVQTLKKHRVLSVGLANNHTFDYGLRAPLTTMEFLKNEGIAFAGAGPNATVASRPLSKTFSSGKNHLRLVIFTGFEYRTSYARDHRFYATGEGAGVAMLQPAGIVSEIKRTRENDPDALIVVFPHWGSNYKWRTKKQRETALRLLDGGADIVIGHGAHMFQEIERYKGKWIIYSLGNFVFNTPGRYHTEPEAHPYSFIADVVLQSTETNSFSGEIRLYPTITDNRKTGYSGRFLNDEEFLEALSLLEQNCKPWGLPSLVGTGYDRFGPYLRLPLKPGNRANP